MNYLYSCIGVKLCLLFFAGGFVFSCTKNKVEQPDDTTMLSACDSLIALSNGRFNCQVKPIIDLHCAISGCHVDGTGANGDFTTYQGVKLKVDNGTFQQRVFQGDPTFMPYNGPLNDSLLQILTDWINNGAPND